MASAGRRRRFRWFGSRRSALSLLEVEDLSVQFGGVHAVDRVSMTLERGAFVGLIGPNGAGKTTLIDALTGFVRATGTIHFDGERLDGLKPHERARRGLIRTFQSIEMFDDLSVHENLLVGASVTRPGRRRLWARNERDEVDGIGWARATLAVDDLEPDRLPTEFSQGQRKLLGVARALASRPKLLLLDEPAAGLDRSESSAVGACLRRLPEQGVSVLLIDHDMNLVLSVCDYVYVLDFGSLIAHGTPVEIRKDPAVIGAYLGDTERPENARARDNGSDT